VNGALVAYFSSLEATLEAARENLSEAEFRALEIALARELGVDREARPRGRPALTVPADLVAEVIRLRTYNGRLSYATIAERVGLSKRQVAKIVRAEALDRK
jgi:AraC-like DNA-binding protein